LHDVELQNPLSDADVLSSSDAHANVCWLRLLAAVPCGLLTIERLGLGLVIVLGQVITQPVR